MNLFQSWGISPAAVIGHSSGEIAAAFACGAISAAQAIIIAYYRGRALKSSNQAGSMAAIGLSRNEVSRYVARGVTVACENSPSSVTLSGDPAPLDNVIRRIETEQPAVYIRKLKVEKAYHSG